MRYEDASGAFQASGPVANDDSDTLPAGSKQAATGNLITGEGTQYASSGADSAAGAHITNIAGKGGEDSSFAGGKLSVAGEFGNLSVDAQGNYIYKANANAPENVRDRFTYTLADSSGNTDTAALVVELGKTPVVVKADAQQVIVGPDGVVTLPPGVELSDIMVVGRNLVVTLPDGSQMIIVDGAIFVPQLVLGGVEVPATNVAALLIGQEPQPAAGELPPSSGGNFALPPPPLDPGVPLGDLIPPMEDTYIPPEPEEVFDTLDEEPEVGPNPDVLLDDDALEAGIAGGVGDDPDSVNATGQLSGSGGDGDLTFAVQLTGAPAGFTYVSGGAGIVLIQQGGVTVLTVTVDADGSYSVVQNAPIDHPAGGDENNVSFTLDYTVTDEDGDSAAGTLTINVDDDTPVLTELVAQDGVTLDESDSIPAGFPISGTSALPVVDFTALFGADGAAAVDSTVLALTITNASSGLRTAVGDFPITLVQVGDTIEGHYDGSNVAFVIELGADGTITLTQNVPLEHLVDGPPGPAHDDSLDLGGLVALSVTITDGDGDVATGQVAIGNLLVFQDDGPNAGDPVGEPGTVVLDETRPEGTDRDDDSPDATLPNGLASATIGFADNFGAPDYGADGAGTVTYKLVLSANGIGSGLYALEAGDTSDGDDDGYGQGAEILLSINGAGTVITGSAGGVDYFTISIDPGTGVVTFAQLNPIWHPVISDFDDQVTLTTDALNDIQVQQTVTDSDGDFDTAAIGIGQGVFSIQDDGPSPYDPCPDDVITINEPGGEPIDGNLNLPDVGEDEPAAVTFGVVDGDPVLDSEGNPVTSGEDALFYFINDQGVLEARVGDETGELIFTITLNGDGTYTYQQIGQIGTGGTITFDNFDEADAGNTNYVGLDGTDVDLLMSAGENTDLDADIEDTTVNTDADSIGAQNQSMDSNDSEVLRLDFVSNLQTGGAGPTGFSFDGHVATNSYLQLVPQVQGSQSEVASFKVWALDSTLTDADAPDRNPTDGFSDASTVTITAVTIVDYETGTTYSEDISGLLVGATEVLDFGVSVTRNADGSVTFSGIQEGDQYGISTGANDFNAIAVQADSGSFDLGVFSIGVANEFEPVDLEVPIVVTDADGDAVTCDIDIHIGAPLEARDITVTVNEAALDDVGSNPGSNAETQGGTLQGLVEGGTGPYTFALAPGESLVGTYGTLTLASDGTFSYTLNTPFDSQPDANDGTNPELAAESFQIVATDSLGAEQTLTINVNIIDDVPTAVDDVGNQVNEGDPITVDVLNNDVEGADGVDEDNNPAVKVELVDGTLTGAGSLVYNNDGTFTYTPDAGEEGSITFDYQITDNDGDVSVATVTINLEDDSEPQIGTPENLAVDEDGFGFANDDANPLQSDPSETDHAENLTDTGEVVVDFGGDVPDAPLVDSIELLDDPAYDGQLTDLDGNPVTFALNGSGQLVGTANSVTVMIISISGAVAGPNPGEVTYSYSAQLLQPVMHADSGNTENSDLLSGIRFEVTDSDDDTAEGTFDVTVWDDVPSASDEPQQNVAEGDTISGTFDFVEGADGASVTHINGTALVFGGGGWSQWIAVDDGQIRAQADGSYEFEADSPAAGVTSGTFTVTDGDGDEVVADWAFNITDANSPTAGTSTARLDDDGLADGNPASTTGDIDANVGERPGEENSEEDIFNGQLTLSFGGDGPGSVTFAAMDGDTGTVGTETVLYSWDGVDTLTATINDGGPRDGTVLFDIVLDTATGEYTLTLRENVHHASGGNETSAPNVALTYTVTDSDNSPAGGVDGTLNITFNDDAPTVEATLNADADVELDESLPSSASTITLVNGIVKGNDPHVPDAGGAAIGRAVSTESVLTLTTEEYGADGPAANPDDAIYTLQVDNATSGLTTTEGDPITLVSQQNGTVIVGVVQGGTFNGQAAFAIQIDPATGIITVEQYLSLDHPVNNDPNDPLSMTAGHISAIVTIEDADGDTDTSSDVDISGLITFRDDGPTAVDADDITTGLVNEIGGTASALLDGGGDDIVANNMGADGGKVIFTDASIDAMEAYNFENSGDPLVYEISPDGQTLRGFVDNGDGVFGAGDTSVIRIQLQTGAGGNFYTVTMDETIDTLVTFQFTDALYDFVGGNDTWAGFALNNQVEGNPGDVPLNDDSKDLLLTPLGTGTAVNGNANSAGTTGPIAGQNIGMGEGMRIDYVSDLSGIPTAGDYNDAAEQTHDYDNHYLVEAAVLQFGDGTSTETTSSFKAIKVSDPADDPLGGLYGDGDDDVPDPLGGTGEDVVSVTSVAISYDGVTETATFDAGDPLTPIVLTVSDRTYTVAFKLDPGGSGEYIAEVTGIYDEAVQMAVFGEEQYNALELLHLGPSDADADYAITGFGFASGEASDVDFSVPISVVDGDGDVVASGDLDIHLDAPESLGFAAATLEATSQSSDASSFSLLASDSQEEQLQKTAANSNTLTLAAAVGAAGITETAAANDGNGSGRGNSQNSDLVSDYSSQYADPGAGDDGGDAAVSMLMAEPANDDAAPADTSSSSSSDSQESSNSLDDGSSQASADGNDAPASDSGNAADSSADAASLVAPAVVMPSAAALQAAANDGVGGGNANENAQQGGTVEQIVAEALGQGGAPLVDAILAGLPGGNGELAAITNLASPHAGSVSSWDMGGQGAIGAGFDMMFKMDVATHHQDAVQPVANG